MFQSSKVQCSICQNTELTISRLWDSNNCFALITCWQVEDVLKDCLAADKDLFVMKIPKDVSICSAEQQIKSRIAMQWFNLYIFIMFGVLEKEIETYWQIISFNFNKVRLRSYFFRNISNILYFCWLISCLFESRHFRDYIITVESLHCGIKSYFEVYWLVGSLQVAKNPKCLFHQHDRYVPLEIWSVI